MNDGLERAGEGRPFGSISVQRYTLSDGLAGMQIEDIHQDRRGLLWIATADGGVSRFDGTRFDTFSTSDGLPHLMVRAIGEDADGGMWFGTLGGGLARLGEHGFEVYTTEQGLPSNDVLGVQPQPDGSLRLLTGAGIAWFAEGRCTATTTAIDGRPIGRVNDMVTDSAGTTWLATRDRGVLSLDGRRLVVGDGGGVQRAWKFAQDSSGLLWIAFHGRSKAAVARYDASEAEVEVIDLGAELKMSELSRYGARHVRVDDRGWVWVGRRRDVLVYDGEVWHSLAERFPEVGFRPTRVTYGDREGSVWVGTSRGLVLLDRLSVQPCREGDGLPDGEITSLKEDGAGRLWIGTEGGLARLEDDRIRPSGMSRVVSALGVDRRGVLWIGGVGGVSEWREAGSQWILLDSEDRSDVTMWLWGDEEERLWVFTRQGKVGWIESDRFVEIDQGLPQGTTCNDVAPDGDGGLWIGVQARTPRLYQMDRSHRVRAVDLAWPKPVSRVKALCQVGSTLWVGTNNGLLAVESEGGKIRRFSKDPDELPSDNIRSLAADSSESLWVGLASGGLLKYDGRTFHDIRLGPSVQENTVKTMLCDRRHQMWFGTFAGLRMYRPPHTPPGIVIRRNVGGRLLEATGAVVCGPEVELHFQGIRLRIGGAGQMAYSRRLVGHGPAEEWSEFGSESKVVYQGLPAGEYRFEVRARDRDDMVSEVASLGLKVAGDAASPRLESVPRERQPSIQTAARQSPTISGLLSRLGPAVETDMTVMLAGETGTGKSLLAGEIHARSPRRDQPFVRLSCGALPPGLVESELFGREQGISGAAARQTGCLERAHGGTLLLDGIGDLPLEAQRALLHVLEDGQVKRVGGSETIQVDVRVIAATNRDLEKAVQEGAFRRDLYYRLNEFPVVLPPLRDRPAEVPVLAAHFAARFAHDLKRSPPSLSDEAVAHLQGHGWPGNVRELEHLIRRAVVLCEGDLIEVPDLPLSAEVPLSDPPVERAASEEKDERQQILEALRTSNWIVYGDRGAARLLGMHPEKLRYRMSKYGLRRPRPSN